MEEAEKRERLVADFIREAVRSARAEIAVAEAELARTAELSKKGFADQTQVHVAKARLDEAHARVKQLETILSTAGIGPTSAAPRPDRDALTRDQIKLAAGFANSERSDSEKVEAVYQAILGRGPTPAELDFSVKHVASMPKDRETALMDIAYSLVQSKDFRAGGNNARRP